MYKQIHKVLKYVYTRKFGEYVSNLPYSFSWVYFPAYELGCLSTAKLLGLSRSGCVL